MFPFPCEVEDAISISLPKIHSHLHNGLPEEVVGLILSDGSIVRLINQARSAVEFTVSQAQLAGVLADINPETHTVYAVYHTHPGGDIVLSPQDQKTLRFHWVVENLALPWLVMVPSGMAALCWVDSQSGGFGTKVFEGAMSYAG